MGFEPPPSEPLTTNLCWRPLPDFLPHAPSALICQSSAVNIKETLHQKHKNGSTHWRGQCYCHIHQNLLIGLPPNRTTCLIGPLFCEQLSCFSANLTCFLDQPCCYASFSKNIRIISTVKVETMLVSPK